MNDDLVIYWLPVCVVTIYNFVLEIKYDDDE